MERSTLAWFRTADTDVSNSPDDTALLIDQLRTTHRIDVVTEATAHDFVWRHFRTPYDLVVYELRDDPAHRFIAAYLVHYPGIVILRGRPVRSHRLSPSARVVVTAHQSAVEALQDEFPDARVRFAPAGIREAQSDVDVIAALDWPPTGDVPLTALAGMAAGKTVIVFETEETADWPALNPQTWQPRDVGTPGRTGPAQPIVVSIDPRDEEHSLKLAMRRLATDVALRQRLGAAARQWWMTHATVDHAVKAWQSIIAEALTLPPVAPAEQLHTPANGTTLARSILEQYGVTVDLF